jgi:hypothetical protein
MKILKTTDKVTIKHNDLEVVFSPLSYSQSLELSALEGVQGGESVVDVAKRTALMIKYAVKEIIGVTDYHGDPVVIKADRELTDDQLSDVITALSKSPVIGPISFISTSCELREFDGIEYMVNGKAVSLKK